MDTKTIIANGKEMHYLVKGSGKPILFLHSLPGTSAVWEPIILQASAYAQCIAVDLIGTGKSDKPRIDYSVEDHVFFLAGFIDALELREFTLVVTGWGSVIGLEYARLHSDRISGLVFTEAYLRIEKNFQEISLVFEKLKLLFMSDAEKLNRILTDAYRKALEDNPYVNPESKVVEIIENYSAWLQKTQIKKLLLYGGHGFLVTRSVVHWAVNNLPTITAIDLGVESTAQSDIAAQKFSEALLSWFK